MAGQVQMLLTPDAVRRLASFRTMPERLPGVLVPIIDKRNEITTGYIQRFKMSIRGPNTLGVVTNRLRSSVRPSKAVAIHDRIISSIGSNVRYAGVHEFGFQGVVQVRAFTRRQVSNDILRGGARRGFVTRQRGEKVLASGLARVRAHQRRMNMPARAPIERGIDDNAVLYRRDLSTAIVKAYDKP